ncbi:peptide deformylase [Dietzia sp. B44]|uniref:peptide deformylase n=1 Tax=Dietzia sp. B44 TaxID=1630633 RepID=UPI0015F8B9B6|nr:peptide deformylase [Dietzia sp. B44]MBB1054352.1 peptide deformylase [Dietzia sp. B44]
MAVHPVRLFGDPVLRTPTDPVTSFDDRLARIVADLMDTVRHEDGAGLAAPQIGVSTRVFVYTCGGREGHLVNPEWEPMGDERTHVNEGCLSIPGVSEPTKRYARVVARGVDVHGEPVRLEAEGILARAVQHETDHLDGILFLQRLTPDRRRSAMAGIRSSGWFGSDAISAGVVYDRLADAMAVR